MGGAIAKFSRFVLLITGSFLLSATAFAQFSLLYQKDGIASDDNLGISVASAGDVNGDGYSDFIIGAADSHDAYSGSAFVYSGADGSLLYQKNGTAAGDNFGTSVAGAGDVNGDGKADFIIGAPASNPSGASFAGSAFIYSGADGSLLYQKNGADDNFRSFGTSVACAGDVNGDDKADFIIGAPLASPNGLANAGSAFVYSGFDGFLLYEKDGDIAGDELGNSVAGVGDVNGDERADYIVGAFAASPGGLFQAGSAYLYSGADGSLLYQKNGPSFQAWFGYSVASAGDADGDRMSDFVIGALLANQNELDQAGSAYLYSGASGGLLYQKNGGAIGDEFGASVACAGDVNGDGKADFIIGAPRSNPNGMNDAGSAYVYSGVTGGLIYQKDGSTGDLLGLSVAGAGDANGDGKVDFIIGASYASPGGISHAGSAFVYGILCPANKGDLNADSSRTPADVVLMLNCVFLSTGNCAPCYADVSCNGILTPTDVVIELSAVFLREPITCVP